MALKYGDDVILMLEDGSTYLIKLKEDSQLGTHRGNIRHSDLIGKNYGDVVDVDKTRVYILKPTMVDYISKG